MQVARRRPGSEWFSLNRATFCFLCLLPSLESGAFYIRPVGLGDLSPLMFPAKKKKFFFSYSDNTFEGKKVHSFASALRRIQDLNKLKNSFSGE